MRVPFSKPYRAFAELDRFSDAECREWVKRAWKAHGAELSAVNVVALIVGAVMMVITAPLTVAGFWSVSDRVIGPWLPLVDMTLLLGVIIVLAAPVVAALWIRDLGMQRSIRRQLAGARCAKCAYSLLGLPVKNGAVTCSECGEPVTLAALGLAAEDLMARPA